MVQLDDYQLSDRYRRTEGTVLLTGIQALARLPVEQLRADRAAGLDTAAFLSGYPGSPLGGLDLELPRAMALEPDLPIVHQPAVNEELGATAVMGSQLAAARPDALHDGVVGYWYGKAPGLDRAGDALRHGVFAGTAARSGAVVLVGDDPACKSSTMPSSSDATLVDLHMPILYPGTVAECLELGLHAVALSRASGLWSSMKIVTPVADGSGTVTLPALADRPRIPTHTVDGHRWEPTPSAHFLGPRMLEMEREFREVRLPLAARYGVENGLNRIAVDPPDAWLGLVATGFTYQQLLDALARLGLDGPDAIGDAGIRLLQLRMPVPFDADLVRRFARGLDRVVVVEEKNPTLEWLVKDALYGAAHTPAVHGKVDGDGSALFRSWGMLDADAIVEPLRRVLAPRLADRLRPAVEPRTRTLIPLAENRTPYFCSGCPHNWGTKVPDGALVGAGTGCHGMTLLMDPERVGETIGITAMGNEGTQWIGMEPFVEADHLVQNYGDGTFFHSGQLAVQNCIAAGKHMTFKILFNGTVAMTGGQDAQAALGLPELVTMLRAMGVAAIAITTEDPGRFKRGPLRDLPAEVKVHHRRHIVDVQRELAAVPGVTVLIHDQACAAELRRDRKRGRIETPTRRVVINPRVCEGCGDCGDVSNCLSVQPVDTPFGRKTTIDQASCNIDESCLDGDCPAFMTVEVDPDASAAGDAASAVVARPEPFAVPEPEATNAPADVVRIRLAGIGGTGVVTAAQIVATAAMFDGWQINGLDQTGLSQKAGPVVSDLTLHRGDAPSNLVGEGRADLVVAFDGLVAAADGPRSAIGPETAVVASSTRTPTGRMVTRPSLPYPVAAIAGRLGLASGGGIDRADADGALGTDGAGAGEAIEAPDAGALARALVGSAAQANLLLLGVALQRGALPVSAQSLARAIDLNGVAAEANRSALHWGRCWAVDPTAVGAKAEIAARAAATGGGVAAEGPSPAPDPGVASAVAGLGLPASVEGVVAMLAQDLVGFQDRALALDFVSHVDRARRAEEAVDPEHTKLTEAVARGLHKLLAYKDEYEVARLLVAPEGRAAVDAVAPPVAGAETTFTWRLHPPLLKAMGLTTKIGVSSRTAPAMRALAAAKRVRGTAFDPFGRTELRRIERALPGEYLAALDVALGGVTPDSLDAVVALAELPDLVRGYEDLKVRRAAEFRLALDEALARLDGVPTTGSERT